MSRFKRVLPLAFGIGLFVFVLLRVDLLKTWELLRRADPASLALAAILAMMWLKAVTWGYLLKMQGYRYPLWDSLLAYMGSVFWGNVTPGRVGDFVKVLYLREACSRAPATP